MPNIEAVAREVLARMSGKWPLWVLHILAEHGTPVRYTQLFRAVEGVSQKVLTQTLRTLERDGFISRRVYAQVPPKVEYDLTELGASLLKQVDPVVVWTRLRVEEILAAQKVFDARQSLAQDASR